MSDIVDRTTVEGLAVVVRRETNVWPGKGFFWVGGFSFNHPALVSGGQKLAYTCVPGARRGAAEKRVKYGSG